MKKRFLQMIATLCSIALLVQWAPVSALTQSGYSDSETVSTNSAYFEETARIVGEDTSRREAGVKHFRLSDGSYIAAVYNEPVHYLQDGRYEEIDNTLKTVTIDGKAYYRNTAGDLVVQLPQKADGEVKLNYNGYSVSWVIDDMVDSFGTKASPEPDRTAQLEAKINQDNTVTLDADIAAMTANEAISAWNEECLKAKKNASAIRYEGIADDTTLQYALSGNRLKESLVFYQEPSQTSFTSRIKAPGLKAALKDDRQVQLSDENGTVVLVLEAPVMWDAQGVASADISVTLTPIEDGWEYTMMPSRVWLTDSSRVYPVTLDPTLHAVCDYSTVKDTTGYRYALTDAQRQAVYQTGNYIYLRIGKTTFLPSSITTSAVEAVSLVYSPMPAYIPSSARIVDAKLNLTYYSSGNMIGQPINAYRITGTWDQDNIMDNNEVLGSLQIPATASEPLDAFALKATPACGTQLTLDITDAAQRWLNGTEPNYGILLSMASPSSGRVYNFYDSDHSSYNNERAPKFIYTYRDTRGIEDYWTYTTVPAGRFGTAAVNNYNNNVTVLLPLDSTTGSRLPVALQLIYQNSADLYADRGYPGRWHINYDWRIRSISSQILPGYPYCLTDGDGTDHYFKLEDGVIRDEDGLGYTLTVDTNGNGVTTGYTVALDGGGSLHFSIIAVSAYLTSITDANGNTAVLTRDPVGTLLSVTDGAGREYTFTYGYTLSNPTNLSGSNINYLTAVTLTAAGEQTGTQVVTINYDSSGMISKVTYADGEYDTFDYDNGELCCINNETTGGATTINYLNTTDPNGKPPYCVSVEYRPSSDTTKSVSYALVQHHNYADITMTTTDTAEQLTDTQTVIYQFDNWGHTIGVVDPESGMAEYYAFGKTGGTGNANKLLTVSALQNSVPNLLVNGGAEQTGGWTLYAPAANGTTSAPLNPVYLGKKSFQLTKNGTTGVVQLRQSLTGLAAGEYTLSAYVSTNGAQISGLGAGLQLLVSNGGTTTTYSSPRLTQTQSNEWQRLTVTATVTAGDTVTACLGFANPTTTGSCFFDAVQLEAGIAPGNVNLIENAALNSGLSGWTYQINGTNATGTCSNGEMQTGNVSAIKTYSYSQTVPVSGDPGDVYSFGGWGHAYSCSTEDIDDANQLLYFRQGQPAFRLRVDFLNSAGTVLSDGTFTENFNFAVNENQFISGQAVAPASYDKIRFQFEYNYNINSASFSRPFLYKLAYGTDYVYRDNELVRTEGREGLVTQYAYNDHRLAASVAPTGSGTSYTYDDNSNLIYAHSSDGISQFYTYDSYGNVLTTTTRVEKPLTSLASGTSGTAARLRNAYSGNELTVLSSSAVNTPHDPAAGPNSGQHWRILPYSDGVYLIVHNASYRALYVNADGTLGVGPFSSSTSYRFTVTFQADGSCLIQSQLYGKYLDGQPDRDGDDMGDTGTGSPVRAMTRDEDTRCQNWYLFPLSSDNAAYIETSATYDSEGNYLTSSTDERGQTTLYSYDTLTGELDSVTDPLGHTTSYRYDTMSRLVKVFSGEDETNADTYVQYEYTNDRLSDILANNGQELFSFGYDAWGNRTTVSVSKPDGTLSHVLSTAAYDLRGNLAGLTYGNGQSVQYGYDALDRLTAVGYNNNSPSYTYAYDSMGRLGRLIDLVGNSRTRYTYDDYGRLLSKIKTYNAAADGGYVQAGLLYTYDAWGRTGRITTQTPYIGTSPSPRASVTEFVYGTGSQSPDRVYGVLHGTDADPTLRLSYTYDDFGRLTARVLNTTVNRTAGYTYLGGGVTNRTTSIPYLVTNDGLPMWYATYDADGNLSGIMEGAAPTTYTYDALHQLVRENCYARGETIAYTYDAGGNILSKTTYPYTTGALDNVTPTATVTYTYGDAGWKDLLTNYNGTPLTYDTIGNPLTYRSGMTMTWQNGRQLATLTKNGATNSYAYDENGIRTKKTVAGAMTTYHVVDGVLLGEFSARGDIVFLYDESGALYGFTRSGTYYYYAFNGQGDVIGMYDQAGDIVAKYSYDTWGAPRTITDGSNNDVSSDATHIANINPIRYRGYYYDTDTGLYYVQSRYYDPVVGRWINADASESLAADAENCAQYNLFAYCFNCPVNMIDADGTWPNWLKKVVAAVAVVAVVATVAAVTVATAGSCSVLAAVAVGAAKGAAVGALTGAATGAATGAVTHRITTGSWQGAGEAALNGMANGALSGAITGAITGGIQGGLEFSANPLCFVAGTVVLTTTGFVAIENIRTGDGVWAENPETGEKAIKPVVQTFVNETSELVHVFVNGEEIVTTPEHPFYVPQKGWTGAVHLRAGDILVLHSGEYVIVEKIQHELLETPIKVYNFEVADFHTYFVGESAMLVHNACSLNTLKDSYIKKTLKINAEALKKEYLGSKVKTQLYDLAVDKSTGIVWIITKAGQKVAETYIKIK